jgi:hypothetical protein
MTKICNLIEGQACIIDQPNSRSLGHQWTGAHLSFSSQDASIKA